MIEAGALKTLLQTIFVGRTVNIWILTNFSVGEWRVFFSP